MRLFRCVHCARSLYIYLYIGGLKAWNISTKFISFHSYIFLFCLNFFFLCFIFILYIFIYFNSKRPQILLSEMSWLLILYIYLNCGSLLVFIYLFNLNVSANFIEQNERFYCMKFVFIYIKSYSYFALYRNVGSFSMLKI